MITSLTCGWRGSCTGRRALVTASGNADVRAAWRDPLGRHHDGGGHSALPRARHMFPQDQQLPRQPPVGWIGGAERRMGGRRSSGRFERRQSNRNKVVMHGTTSERLVGSPPIYQSTLRSSISLYFASYSAVISGNTSSVGRISRHLQSSASSSVISRPLSYGRMTV